MGRRGLLQAFVPLRQRHSQPWRTPSNPPGKEASSLSRKRKNSDGIVFAQRHHNNQNLKAQSNLKAKAFQQKDEDLSLECSIHYSSIFPSQRSLESGTQSTAITTDAMSTMSNHGIVPETNEKIVQFDFDPGLRLNKKSCDIQIQVDKSDSIPTDLKVQDHLRHRNADVKNEHIEENYNQYIAKKFNRSRIEFYLDLLCPPEENVKEDSYQEPVQEVPLTELEFALPHLPNKGPDNDYKLTRTFSEEENQSKLTKSFEGFSLEADDIRTAKVIPYEPSYYESGFTDQENHHGEETKIENDENNRLNFIIRTRMKVKVPSSININVINDADDELTIGESEIDEGEIITNGDTISPSLVPSVPGHETMKDESQMMIQLTDTYDSTNSPTGIEEFDLAQLRSNPKVSTRLTSPCNIAGINEQRSSPHNNETNHYYHPMTTTTTSNQINKKNNHLKIKHDSKEKVNNLRSNLDRIAKLTSSQSPSVKSFASPVTYNSANIAKIKSRMRQIESQYEKLRISTVQH